MVSHGYRKQYFTSKCPQPLCGALFRTQSLAYSIDPERMCPRCARNFVFEYNKTMNIKVHDERRIKSTVPALQHLKVRVEKITYDDEGMNVRVKLLERKPGTAWHVGDEIDLHPYELTDV